jgi:hypothetical protein
MGMSMHSLIESIKSNHIVVRAGAEDIKQGQGKAASDQTGQSLSGLVYGVDWMIQAA